MLVKYQINSNQRLFFTFHNNPLDISGSKTVNERKELLNKCEYIF